MDFHWLSATVTRHLTVELPSSQHIWFFLYIYLPRGQLWTKIPAFDFLQSRKWLFYIYIFFKMQLWWQRPLQRCGTVLTSAVFLCICQETVVLLVGSFTFYMTFDLYATWPLMVCVAVLLSHTRPAPHRHGVNVFYLIVYGGRKKKCLPETKIMQVFPRSSSSWSWFDSDLLASFVNTVLSQCNESLWLHLTLRKSISQGCVSIDVSQKKPDRVFGYNSVVVKKERIYILGKQYWSSAVCKQRHSSSVSGAGAIIRPGLDSASTFRENKRKKMFFQRNCSISWK